jgi:hypothetical protein
VYLDSGWHWIDQMIGWCKAHHIYVILCMHAAPGAQNPELMSDTVDGKPHLWTQPLVYQPWAEELRLPASLALQHVVVTDYDGLGIPPLSSNIFAHVMEVSARLLLSLSPGHDFQGLNVALHLCSNLVFGNF